MDASKVMLLADPIMMTGCNKHYAPIITQCVNALADKGKYNKFSVIHSKLITLYFFINYVYIYVDNRRMSSMLIVFT